MPEMQKWFSVLREQFYQTDIIQWGALSFGVAEVLLARANNIWLYPAGIGAAGLAIVSLGNAGLYAESILNLYYVVMSVYGWWFWFHRKNVPPVEIRRAGRSEWIVSLSIVFAGWGVLGIILVTFTSSTVPLWDAWVTSTAWAGTWLLARRRIENWILLNLSNAFAIPLLFYKDLPLFALLTVFLFVVACKGYLDWVRILEVQRVQSFKVSP